MILFWKLNIRQTKQNWKKNPKVIDFVKKSKRTELENKIPDVSNLATKIALTAVENNIPSVSSLVKKKQTITQKLLKLKRNLLIITMTSILLLQSLAADIFNPRLAQGNLTTKTNFDDKLSNLNRKITANK